MSDGPTARQARIERETRETKISLELDLGGGEVAPETGIGFFDHMLELLGRHANVGLVVRASGDLETGGHHTVEDVGIALGQALDRALGDRSGIRRYGHAVVPMDESARRMRDRRLGAPVLSLRRRDPAGRDRRFRGRAHRGVLPRRRREREAHGCTSTPATAATPTT